MSIKLIVVGMLFFGTAIGGSGQMITSKAFPDQYKKQNRNAIAWLIDGHIDSSINYFQHYLSVFPEDLESHFGLCVAYTAKGDLSLALTEAKLAVRKGMPIERFLAGPQSLLADLWEDEEFKTWTEKASKGIIHGPMQGHTTDSTASIWLRLHQENIVELWIDGKVRDRGLAPESNDYSLVLEATHLDASQEYDYDLKVKGETVYTGKLSTFPKMGNPSIFQIGFGGGAGYTPQYERVWDTIQQHRVLAFLLMGDNIYHDHPEYLEIQDYCYHRRQSRPEFRRFASQQAVYAIWDDHDFGDNDCFGGTRVDSPSWKIPVWEKFQHQWANPYYGGGRENPGCYFNFSIGDVDFFMLDTRFYRTNGKDEIKPDTMLGAEQLSWLKKHLLTSTASFKCIGTSVPISSGTKSGKGGLDTWDGFAEEREDIFHFIETNGIEGVVFLAADRHRSDAWKTTRNSGYPFYEFMSSRLTNIHTHPVQDASLFGYSAAPSFGLLEFDTQAVDPRLTYKIMSIDNQEIHRISIYKSQLTVPK